MRPLGGTQAANDEAGFDVGHFIGWRYISSGCSTVSHTTFHPSPRSRLWTGLLWPGDIHIHIYVQSRPLSLPPPRAQGPRDTVACGHPNPTSQVVGALLVKALARWTGPRRHPFSLIPFPPRRLPSVHLSLPTGECSGPTETGAQSPSPLRQGGTPWSLVPAPHRNPRPRRDRSPWLTALPASVPCHAGWTDGSVAQVHAASPAVRLPSHCHFAAPPRPRRSALLKRRPVK